MIFPSDPTLLILQVTPSDGIIGAVVGAALTGLIAYISGRSAAESARASLTESLRNLRSDYDRLTQEANALREDVSRLQPLSERYMAVRQELEKSLVVKDYHQPVLLIGPRGVGKTSLLMQWHAPWDHRSLAGTDGVTAAVVPIHDFKESDAEPHFADPTVRTSVHGHLRLKVFDFPGELSAQQAVRDVAIEETRALNRNGRPELGVVLICMFSADEARTGISRETREYYNGGMFRELRSLIVGGSVSVERVVLVFNRYDALREVAGPDPSDVDLLNECVELFEPVYSPLQMLGARERLCATFTVLVREGMRENNRGAPIVKGEAARAFVAAYAGKEAAGELIKTRAVPVPGTIFSAPAVY